MLLRRLFLSNAAPVQNQSFACPVARSSLVTTFRPAGVSGKNQLKYRNSLSPSPAASSTRSPNRSVLVVPSLIVARLAFVYVNRDNVGDFSWADHHP